MSSFQRNPPTQTIGKLIELTSSIVENKKETSREPPKPSHNLLWKCHMSTAWQTSSKRRQTCSRNLQCEESHTRTRSRRAPRGRQQQHRMLLKNNGPQLDLPPLVLPRPLPCPPLMAVRQWEVILAEIPHNHLGPPSLGPSTFCSSAIQLILCAGSTSSTRGPAR